VTYTPKSLADFVAERICEAGLPALRSCPIRLLDPAVGDGELLLSLLGQLHRCGVAAPEVHGFETDTTALNTATARIRQDFPHALLNLTKGNFLEHVVDRRPPPGGRAPLDEREPPHERGPTGERGRPDGGHSSTFDLVIANPPYVRTQILGAERAQRLSARFELTGRVDLQFAFIVGIAQMMRPGAIGGLIVSNRFMTTQSGGAVRRAIRTHFKVLHVWDLGDTRLFDAAVLPAMLLVEKYQNSQRESVGLAPEPADVVPEPGGFTSIYESRAEPTQSAGDVIDALSGEGVVAIGDGRRFNVRKGTLNSGTTADAVWRFADAKSSAWLAAVESNTWRRFGDIGRIRVGVKTCADQVFIRTDWDEMPEATRPELLRPLTTHHSARRFRAASGAPARRLLYPHATLNGVRRPVDLASYPRAAAYLAGHRELLSGRRYVLEAGRQWYEIWVPQDPSAWAAPKLVFRDIAEQPTFWLDLQGTIVNGDCYWLSATRAQDEELLWLAAAVANSSFIEAFYDHQFNNKLYAGRRRFMTQYVARFPLPDPSLSRSREIIARSKRQYELADELVDEHSHSRVLADSANTLDRLVWAAFGTGSLS